MPEVKSPDLILKLAEAMKTGGFLDMEISPEEFCNLVNYHGASLQKLNWAIPKRKHPLLIWAGYSSEEKQKKAYSPALREAIKQNPKPKFYSQLSFQDHTLITEHSNQIVEI